MQASESKTVHASVLLEEVATALSTTSEGDRQPLLLDGTLGGGGHMERLLSDNPELLAIGLDKDVSALERTGSRLADFGSRLTCLNGNFADFAELIEGIDPETKRRLEAQTVYPAFDRILVDLGLSSDQLEDKERGFSFRYDSALDMRMDQSAELSAETIVNQYSMHDLVVVFKVGGLGSYSVPLARRIISSRPIEGTRQLASICDEVLKPKKRKASGRDRHLATVPFQAIRIAVNNEFTDLDEFLGLCQDHLAPRGRLAVISFHSLEDRAVTKAMRSWSRVEPTPRNLPALVEEKKPFGKLLTKEAIVPSLDEININPRARSAKLRVFERGIN